MLTTKFYKITIFINFICILITVSCSNNHNLYQTTRQWQLNKIFPQPLNTGKIYLVPEIPNIKNRIIFSSNEQNELLIQQTISLITQMLTSVKFDKNDKIILKQANNLNNSPITDPQIAQVTLQIINLLQNTNKLIFINDQQFNNAKLKIGMLSDDNLNTFSKMIDFVRALKIKYILFYHIKNSLLNLQLISSNNGEIIWYN